MSTLYSLILLKHRIPHNLLNATTAAKESWIISEAGKKGAVTVATSMAGRGTDIKLEQDARENGGLLVVGTERMTSDRIDNQLRGAPDVKETLVIAFFMYPWRIKSLLKVHLNGQPRNENY